MRITPERGLWALLLLFGKKKTKQNTSCRSSIISRGQPLPLPLQKRFHLYFQQLVLLKMVSGAQGRWGAFTDEWRCKKQFLCLSLAGCCSTAGAGEGAAKPATGTCCAPAPDPEKTFSPKGKTFINNSLWNSAFQLPGYGQLRVETGPHAHSTIILS